MSETIGITNPAYLQAANEFKKDASPRPVPTAHELVLAFAKSNSATPEGIVALHRDLFFLYTHGLTFAEYIASISGKP